MLRPQRIARFILNTHLWNPSKAWVLGSHYFCSDRISKTPNQKHLMSALAWLKRAHDVTCDGGVAGRFLLDRGYTESYPETSGYIINTFIKATERFHDNSYLERCEKIVSFLKSVQMESGAFPGGEYNKNRNHSPIIFNTGQIMLGLLAWYAKTDDQTVLEPLQRSASWLTDVQEKDGSWEKHTYGSIKTAYHTRVAWPLAQYGQTFSDEKSIKGASKFIDWVLTNSNQETGWISRMDFSEENHKKQESITHTIAYTYRGLLEYALLFERSDIFDLVSTAGKNIVQLYNSERYLSGIINSHWSNIGDFTCMTGNCQLAILWMKLYDLNKDKLFLNAAEGVLNQVKTWQSLHSINSGIRGGICGSLPIWGSYITYGYPNWATKFFADALMLLDEVNSDSLSTRDRDSL